MPSKEKVLLVIVIGVVAAVAATDKGYSPVGVPATRPPSDIPPVPPGAESFPRMPRPSGRSLLDHYSDLVAPPFAELTPLPVPRVPVPVPPVRPWFHVDAAAGPRHFFFEPAEPPAKEEAPAEDAGAAEAGTEEPGKPSEGEAAAPRPVPVDLSLFDWVVAKDGLGQKIYGKIDLLPADQEAKKSRFALLVDPAMEFTFWQITVKDGRFQGGPVPFRARTEQLGFADTFANNYGSKRILMEHAAGRPNLDIPQLRELAAWAIEEAGKPKYRKRECWAQAAADYREALKRNTNDRETLRDLARTLRLLHDLEGECQLYEWWLKALPQDDEMIAQHGEVLERMGLRERALEEYERSLRTTPDARVRLRLGNLLLDGGSLGDARRAVDVFRRCIQDGERTSGAVGEARALFATGDVEGAAAALDKVGPGDRDGGWYNSAGAVAYARGKLEEARGDFQAAMEKSAVGDDQFAVARTNLAVARARLGAAMAESDPGRKAALEEAVRIAGEALKDDPLNYYWPLVARGYALRALGSKDLAVEALQEAVAAWPQEPYGRTLLGDFLLRDGRAAEARTQFLESARLGPRFPDALAGVGRCQGGAPGESKEYIRRAMGLEPRVGLWPILSARMALLDEGLPVNQRLEEARRDLAYLLEKVEKSHPFGLVSMGWVRYYQGDAEDALSKWNAALGVTQGGGGGTPMEQAQIEGIRAWVKEAIQKVYKWKNTRILRDDFNRPDGPAAGNLWMEDEKVLKLSLKGGAVQWGPGQAVEGERPTLWREFDASKVLKAFFEVEMGPRENAAMEVVFRLPQGKTDTTVMALVRRENGTVVLRLKKDQKTKENEEYVEIPGFSWPEDGKVTFGFVKMNEEKGVVSLLLNGKPVAGAENVEILNLIKSRGGKLRIEVKCYAQGGTEVNCRVEAAEVWLDVQ